MSKITDMLAVAMAAMCVCAFLAGCERGASPKPAAPAQTNDVSRANDPEYRAQLKGMVDARRAADQRRAKIEAQMERLRALAKAALPAGATPEQIKAELENNPKKYPGWREFAAALKANDAEQARNRAAATAAIGRRIQQEVAEQSAAAK